MVSKVLLSLLFLVSMPKVNALTLDEVLNYTLKSSPDLLVTKSEQQAAKARLSQSISAYLPSLDITGSIARDKNDNATTRSNSGGSVTLSERRASFNLQQLIFDGFATKHNIEQSNYLFKQANHNYAGTMDDVSLRTIESYLEVLRRQQLVKFAKASLDSHQKIFRQIELRAESGIGRQSDLDQVQGRLSLARSNLITEQANLRDAEATFYRVIGIKPDQLILPEGPTEEIPASMDAAIALSLINHPQLIAQQAAVKAAKAANKSAKGQYLPSVNFILSGADDKNTGGTVGDSNSINASLQLTYNVFRGGLDRARERETAWNYQASMETLRQTRLQIEQSTMISWNAYISAKSQLRYLREHKEATERTLKAYQSQFTIGQRTLLDLLDSENELLSSKSSYISGQYTELLGRYRVLNSIGILAKVIYKQPINSV